MVFFRHEVACSPSNMKHLNHHNNNKEMSNFYLSQSMCHFIYFTADIITDTFESDLHVIEPRNIHQHVLKQ